MVSLGYGKPSGDIQFSWSYTPTRDQAFFRVSWRSEGFLDLRISGALGNLTSEGVVMAENVIGEWLTSDGVPAIGGLPALASVTLERLSLVVVDRGLNDRLQQYDDYAVAMAGSEELLAGRSTSPRIQLIEWLDRRDAAVRNPIVDFLQGDAGDSFRFDYHPPHGIRLSSPMINDKDTGVIASIDRAAGQGYLSADAG